MGRRARACEIGIEFGMMATGKFNAITDVEGVGVGHTTLILGEGPLKVGEGPVRAGVTAIVPHQGNPYEEKVTAAVEIFNAYGKSTGLPQVMHMLWSARRTAASSTTPSAATSGRSMSSRPLTWRGAPRAEALSRRGTWAVALP